MIAFYDKGKPYYEFSNYYRSPVTIDGIEYPCTEIYFQAQKFVHEEEYFRLICACDSPQKSKNMGTQRVDYRGESWYINKDKKELGKVNDIIRKYKHVRIRDDWDDVKVGIMANALSHKFAQNRTLHNLLMDTYPHDLKEDSPRDDFWGGKRNMLGRLLVALRDKHLEQQL